jgi:hypothetical protein
VYWWNVRSLIRVLRSHEVGMAESFRYLMAHTCIVGLGLTLRPSVAGRLEYMSDLIFSITAIAGTYLAYRANGGADGLDFFTRYFAIVWVSTVRFSVVLILAFLLLHAYLRARGVLPAVRSTAPQDLTLPELALYGFASLLYWWRVCAHMRQAAVPLPQPKSVAA